MVRLDEVNLRILQLLQRNGRMTVAEMAQTISRSESTVRERIASLELDGLLQGYQARVDWSRVGLPAVGVLRASCELSRASDIAAKLAAIPNVTHALLTTGPRPVLVVLHVRDLGHLQAILSEHFTDGLLTNIEADVALESLVAPRPPETGEPVEPKGLLDRVST